MITESKIVSLAILLVHFRREYAQLEIDKHRLRRAINNGGSKGRSGNITSWKQGIEDCRAAQAEIIACVGDLFEQIEDEVKKLTAGEKEDIRRRVSLGSYDSEHGLCRKNVVDHW